MPQRAALGRRDVSELVLNDADRALIVRNIVATVTAQIAAPNDIDLTIVLEHERRIVLAVVGLAFPVTERDARASAQLGAGAREVTRFVSHHGEEHARVVDGKVRNEAGDLTG